jgi:hypothetical protein
MDYTYYKDFVEYLLADMDTFDFLVYKVEDMIVTGEHFAAPEAWVYLIIL